MRVLIFGATGMVGQGVLRECLSSAEVTEIVTVGRTPVDASSLPNAAKLLQLTLPDLFDLSPITDQLRNIDACFFCLGVSSFRMKEPAYRRITYDLTLSVAKSLVQLSPQATFIYVSGAGTDSTEKGRVMWARVKGETENALLRMGFAGAYMFRPGAILPGDGIRSKTPLYQAVYDVMRPVMPWLQRRFPQYITTTSQVGKAMLAVASKGYPKRLLEQADLSDF